MATLSGCSNDLQFNSPALQGNKNYKLWRAKYYDAVLAENGSFTIMSGDNIEKLSITLTALQEGTYSLSDTSGSEIEFVDSENVRYSTRNSPAAKGKVDPQIGTLTITKIENNTLTGSFVFIAFTADGMNSVGFNDGVMYRIPFR